MKLFKPYSIFYWPFQGGILFVVFFMFHVCLSYAVVSVPRILLVTFWKRLTSWFSCVLCFLCFCHFPKWCPGSGVVLDCIDSWPQSYKTWVHSQTQNKAQWLADCGHVSAISQSLRFILTMVECTPTERFLTSFDEETYQAEHQQSRRLKTLQMKLTPLYWPLWTHYVSQFPWNRRKRRHADQWLTTSTGMAVLWWCQEMAIITLVWCRKMRLRESETKNIIKPMA